MDQVMPYLQSLGPWGWVAAAVLVGLQYFRNRQQPPVKTPAIPVLPAAGAPASGSVAVMTDVDKLLSLNAQCTAALQAKHDEHAAELAKLKSVLPTTK